MADRTSSSPAPYEEHSPAPQDFATLSTSAESHERAGFRIPRKRTISRAQDTEDLHARASASVSQRSSTPSSTPSPAAAKGHASTERCRLLELPLELRELIWSHAVVEWSSLKLPAESPCADLTPWLYRRPIRMDRFNRPQPPALTIASHQLRKETLHLYYQLNEFECWRPLFWLKDWSQSTFVDWLSSLTPKQRKWLGGIVLLYKHESELEYDIGIALAEAGFDLKDGVITNRQELSEYEMCFADLGLPRHFGKKRRWDRWMAGSTT